MSMTSHDLPSYDIGELVDFIPGARGSVEIHAKVEHMSEALRSCYSCSGLGYAVHAGYPLPCLSCSGRGYC